MSATPLEVGLLAGGAALGTSGVLGTVALAVTAQAAQAPPAQIAAAADPAALSFSAGEIAVVTALLGAVAGALALMFRTLQAEKAERIKDLAAQLTLAQGQAAALQATAAAHVDRLVELMQGSITSSRDAAFKMTEALDELQLLLREGRELNTRAHESDAEQHREIVVTLHAIAQSMGRTLGDSRDPHVQEMREEARKLVTEGTRGAGAGRGAGHAGVGAT